MVKMKNRGNFYSSGVSVLHLFTFICLCFSLVLCEFPVISEKSVVTLSLKNYNVNDPDGQSLEVKYLMKANSKCVIQITSIPEDAHFVILQVHSYLKNMTLSYDLEVTRSTSISGSNIGLLKTKTSPFLNYYLTYNTSADDATVMIAVQAYGVHAPVPGGCNMEFEVETSPFLKTRFDHAITEIDFAPAAPSVSLMSQFLIDDSDMCNLVPDPVRYRLYKMYLPERNFSEELYYNSIKMMMTKGQIVQNGRSIPNKYGVSVTRHSFASYPGTGSVFVVLAETENGSAVYVPSLTYSCRIDNESNECRILTTTFSKLLCAAIFFLGLFACFAAHRFFKIELLLMGFLSGSLVCYVLALNFHGSDPLSLAVGIGSVFGAFFIVIWCFRGMPLFSLIVASSILGYFTASFIFYKLVDLFDAFQSDINYWTLFCSIILLAPIIMISLAEKANIIACSVVGSYAAVLAVDYYIGSNLRYIIINTIRRATVPQFKHAIIDPPFQTKDIALTSVWAVLAMAGITVQLLLVRGRPPYPAPYNPFKFFWKKFTERTGINKSPNETTPLLRSCA